MFGRRGEEFFKERVRQIDNSEEEGDEAEEESVGRRGVSKEV